MSLPLDPPHKTHAQTAISRSRTRQALIFVVLVGLVVAAGFGYSGFRKKKVKAPTYTYVSALSTAPGMVAQILVKPGEQVRKGELLAVMDFGQLEAAREAAQQAVWNAVSGASAENQAVATQIPPTPGMTGGFDAKIVPTGKLPPPMPPVRSNNIPMAAKGPIPAAPVTPKVNPLASLNTSQDDAKVTGLQAKIKAEQDAVADLQKSFTAEQDAATSAEDLVNSLTTVAARTKADSDKSATLLAEGVISAREASRSQGYAQQAEAQLEAAKVHAAADEATLGDTQRTINETAKQIVVDQDSLKKAQADADAARKAAADAAAAAAAKPAQVPAFAPAKPMGQFKIIRVPTPPAAPAPPPTPLHIAFLPPALQAQKIAQAEDQLDAVNKKFAGACIYAPEDGVVTRIAVRPGQMVGASTVAVVIQKR